MATVTPPRSGTDLVTHTRLAVDRLAPRWTMWTLHMLHEGPRTSGQIAKNMPWISQPTMSLRMGAMSKPRRQALIAPVPDAPRGTYTLTRRGASLEPIQRSLAAWGHTHLRLPQPTAAAEYEEMGLRVLRPPHAAAILDLLRDGQARTTREIDDVLPDGLSSTAVHHSLTQLLAPGVVTRANAGGSALYTLTDRGRDLVDIADALAGWSGWAALDTTPTTPSRPALATTRLPIPPVVFSHREGPDPATPAVAVPRPALARR